MATTYVRQLPNLNLATRQVAYEKLSLLCSHALNLGTDLLSVVVDTVALTVTVTLTNPVDDPEQRKHLGLEAP